MLFVFRYQKVANIFKRVFLISNSAKGGKMIEKEFPKISEKNDKFEFTGETITLDYRTLYRIRAKRDIIVYGRVVAKKR